MKRRFSVCIRSIVEDEGERHIVATFCVASKFLVGPRFCIWRGTLFKSILSWLAVEVCWLAVEVLSPCQK